MSENQGLPYVLGHGGLCPECGSLNTTHDPNFGHRICEDCTYIWAFDEDDPDYDEGEAPDLGTCCICGEEGRKTRNIVTVERRAPVPGTGWGCLVCNLPYDGAMAVVCDDCLPVMGGHMELKEVIAGNPAEKKRVAFSELPAGEFRHIEEIHEREGV